MIRDASVNSPLGHGRFLHGASTEDFTVAQKNGPGGRWEQHSGPFETLADVLCAFGGATDVYISPNRFYGSRKVSRLAALRAMFSDVDYYNVPDLAGMHPVGILDLALEALERAGIPPPSLAVATGRGLALLWRHEPVPRNAHSRWRACQDRIFESLRPLGADSSAKNAATVLRLVGTYDSKSGTLVEPIWKDPEDHVWSFDDLAKRILPLDRAELRDVRVQRALRASQSRSERLQAPPQGFTKASLWEARLSDLQRLRELRFMDAQMADYRDRWMFLSGVAMSWLAVPAVLQRELYALAHQAGGWTEGHARSKLQAVFRTVHAAARGEKVQYADVEVDPRYRFKNQTIIELLEITGDEEREMRTVISDDERRRRDREEKKDKRREAGRMSREMYEGRAADRRSEARRMASEGLHAEEIAKSLGVSIHSVRSYLYR